MSQYKNLSGPKHKSNCIVFILNNFAFFTSLNTGFSPNGAKWSMAICRSNVRLDLNAGTLM